MGTVFSVDVRSPGVEASAVEEVERWLHQVDATFSTYRADSAISRIRRGETTAAQCGSMVREVLHRCAQLTELTDGCFSAYPDGQLDPSGLVKGWAIERASDMLCAAGSTSHCVNGGGDVQCVGRPAPGADWRIGIADPLRAGVLAAVVVGADIAVATSGSSERGAHVIDPRSGRSPVGLASITVVGARLADVDAFATAAFGMGDEARLWLDRQDGFEGFAVGSDGATWATSGWRTDSAR
jgi:thiamine biosynthesis lipoprotein